MPTRAGTYSNVGIDVIGFTFFCLPLDCVPPRRLSFFYNVSFSNFLGIYPLKSQSYICCVQCSLISACSRVLASYPGLLAPVFVTCNTNAGKARGGSTGSWTGCNLKTGRCCMIAFLSCLNFALPILRPVLRLCLPLPTLVP